MKLYNIYYDQEKGDQPIYQGTTNNLDKWLEEHNKLILEDGNTFIEPETLDDFIIEEVDSYIFEEVSDDEYQKLEWIHSQISELKDGVEVDLETMQYFIEDLREPYLEGKRS